MLRVSQLHGFNDEGRLGGNDSFTKILLHFDGTDGSTTITDNNAGGSAHTWTANGNAQIDTAISKFGGAAGLFDGTGDYVSTPDHADFTLGSLDFTIDSWFNRAGGDGGRRLLCGQSNNAGTTVSAFIELTAANVLRFAVSADGTAVTAVTGTTAFTSTGWHHVAGVRMGNTLKLLVDGVPEGGDVSFSSSVFDSSSTYSVGRLGAITTLNWNGSIDEFRLSVGIARWGGGFILPHVPYS